MHSLTVKFGLVLNRKLYFTEHVSKSWRGLIIVDLRKGLDKPSFNASHQKRSRQGERCRQTSTAGFSSSFCSCSAGGCSSSPSPLSSSESAGAASSASAGVSLKGEVTQLIRRLARPEVALTVEDKMPLQTGSLHGRDTTEQISSTHRTDKLHPLNR